MRSKITKRTKRKKQIVGRETETTSDKRGRVPKGDTLERQSRQGGK